MTRAGGKYTYRKGGQGRLITLGWVNKYLGIKDNMIRMKSHNKNKYQIC